MSLKKIFEGLLRLFARRKSSVIEALATMLSPEVLEAVIVASKTQGHITEVAAKALNVSEDVLVAELAHELGIAYLANVLPVDLDLFPADRSLSQYRRAISIPLLGSEGISCLVVSDPFRAQSLLRPGEIVPFVLAKATSILQALDDSEAAHRVKQEKIRQDKIAEAIALGLEAVSSMVSEAENYGSSSLMVRFPRSGVVYSFVTSDGKEGTGTGTDDLRDSIYEIMVSAVGAGINLSGRTLKVKEIVRAREYEVVLKELPLRARANLMDVAGDNVVQVAFGADRELSAKSLGNIEEDRSEIDTQKIVLIVDDNQTLASVLERFLGRQGLKAVLAENGEKALMLLKSGAVRPVAIVSDLHMPRMDGAEMLREIRSMPELQDIPVVMLTSDNEMETEIELLESGADAFVAKNEDPRILCAHVKRLVSRRQRRVA
jgi:CheY-like chemotaxis protein